MAEGERVQKHNFLILVHTTSEGRFVRPKKEGQSGKV